MSKWDRHNNKKYQGAKLKKAECEENTTEYDNGDAGEEDSNEEWEAVSIPVRICLWEFGQNDPKRYAFSL